MTRKECPMCGELMRLETKDRPEHIPGEPRPRVRKIQEWTCPECDHFEEAEAETAGR